MAIWLAAYFNTDGRFLAQYDLRLQGLQRVETAPFPSRAEDLGRGVIVAAPYILWPEQRPGTVWFDTGPGDLDVTMWGDALRPNARGELAGGSITTALLDNDRTGAFWLVEDTAIPVAALRAARATASTADDAALVASLMAGDDVIDVPLAAQARDLIRAGGGDDFVFSGQLGDWLFGGAGRDAMQAGDGDDRLWGGTGGDALAGGRGNDRLYGNLGDDVISGGPGDDRISGGAGFDRFVFRENFGAPPSGNDVVFGFQDGIDRLLLPTVSGLRNITITAVDADTALIRLPFGTVRVEGVAAAGLGRGDFLFGDAAFADLRASERAVLSANDYMFL